MDRRVYNDQTSWGNYQESSVRTPNYRKILASGGRLPVNPYYFYRVDGKSPVASTYNGDRTQRDVGNLYTFRDAVTNGYIYGGSSCATLSRSRDEVTNTLLKKVRDSQIDLGVALGEARETAAFISSAMFKVGLSYRQLRRGNVSLAVQTLTGKHNDAWRDIPGVAANTWLAYSYGLRPLLKDVHDASALLQKGYQAQPDPITVRSTKETSVGASGVHDSYYFDDVNGKIRTSGAVSFYVSNPLFRTLDQCGVLNPLSIAWELVPFSFVVDWFVPVGTFIQNIVPPQGVSFVEGFISQKATGSMKQRTAIPWGWFTELSTKEIIKSRSSLGAIPSYSVIVPDLSLSNEKIASGLALLFTVLTESRTTPGKGNFSITA